MKSKLNLICNRKCNTINQLLISDQGKHTSRVTVQRFVTIKICLAISTNNIFEIVSLVLD